jgi:hypothetical protein
MIIKTVLVVENVVTVVIKFISKDKTAKIVLTVQWMWIVLMK